MPCTPSYRRVQKGSVQAGASGSPVSPFPGPRWVNWLKIRNPGKDIQRELGTMPFLNISGFSWQILFTASPEIF